MPAQGESMVQTVLPAPVTEIAGFNSPLLFFDPNEHQKVSSLM
jgi:hypothetical protein